MMENSDRRVTMIVPPLFLYSMGGCAAAGRAAADRTPLRQRRRSRWGERAQRQECEHRHDEQLEQLPALRACDTAGERLSGLAQLAPQVTALLSASYRLT